MKIGLIGAGNIVKSCLDAIRNVPDIVCEAIFVKERSAEKAKELMQEYNISKLYTDYDAFLKDPDIDIVYIGVPNSFHYEYALSALNNNKHVICEKPFTSDSNELKVLSDLAKNKKLFLFEAITMLYSPNFLYLKEKVKEIGDIKLVQCNYSQYSSRYPQYLNGVVLPAFDPVLSGGALYDINIYNVHFTCALFGEPLSVEYVVNKGFNGIDTSGVLLLQYPEFIAVCCGAKDSQNPSHATVQGTKGYIRLTSAPNTSKAVESYIDNELTETNHNKYENHMVYELSAFCSMFMNNDYEACYKNLDHSIAVMNILTKARKTAGIEFASDSGK